VAGGGRSRADDALVLGLAAGLTVAAAAKRAKVSERTAYRRLADSAFSRLLVEARAAMLDRALGRLAESAARAAATLRRLLRNGPGNVQVAAARAILTLGIKLQESVGLEARIRALEEQDKEEARE
jgi:hypothetical protein